MKRNYMIAQLVNTDTHGEELVRLTNLHVTNGGTIYITYVDEKGNEHVKLAQSDMTVAKIMF